MTSAWLVIITHCVIKLHIFLPDFLKAFRNLATNLTEEAGEKDSGIPQQSRGFKPTTAT
jgi:hypothetical protein